MKNNNFKKFQFNLDYAIKKLQNLPQSEKTDEVSTPLYLHRNFFVRNIFINRFKKAFKMTEFSQKQVLDYGCGSGMFLHALSNEIKNGIGVDLDTDVANKIISANNITLKQIKHESEISYLSNIDIITSFDVLEHIENLDSVFDTFEKILSKDGIILISGPTENFFYRLARMITRFGVKGNLLGEKEHVTDIVKIKNKMLIRGYKIEKNVNLWSLFHITSFSLN